MRKGQGNKTMKIIRSLPFLALVGISIYTWLTFVTSEYIATVQHIAGLVLTLINLPLYFIRLKIALNFTGAILLFATFNLLAFFPDISYSSFGIGPIRTPNIQLSSLLLLIVFLAINWSFLRRKEPVILSK
jgi:hypothetical protein